MNYRSLEKGKRKKPICGREIFPGIRFFYLFHKCDGNGFSSNMRHLFYCCLSEWEFFVAKDLIFHNAVVEGWISTMSFMALGFFGVFAFTDDYFEIFVCNAEFDF